ALAGRQLDPALPAMKAHGVPWLIRHIRSEIDLPAAVDTAKRDTRRYSKRQATWFRHQLPDWTWIAPERALGETRRPLGRCRVRFRRQKATAATARPAARIHHAGRTSMSMSKWASRTRRASTPRVNRESFASPVGVTAAVRAGRSRRWSGVTSPLRR